MVYLDSEAHLDHRVHLVLQVCLVNQVYQASLEIKEQRDHEDLRGYRVWTGSPDSRVRKATEDRKARVVCRGETAAHLDLRDLPGLQDRSSTSRRTIEEAACRVEQDYLGPQDQKGTKETQVLQDMHLKGRKESLASSWALTGVLSTSAASQDCRARVDPPGLSDLQVHMVLQARRETSGFQEDQVVRV